MPLTHTSISKAKILDKAYKLKDKRGVIWDDGLSVEIRPSGKKVFIVQFFCNKKGGFYTVGEYPHVSLIDARGERDRVKRLAKSGINPNKQKRIDKRRVAVNYDYTFERVMRQWHLETSKKWTPRYAKAVMRSFENHVLKTLGSMPIQNIEPRDVLQLLKIIAVKTPAVSIMIKPLISLIFNYAIIESLIKTNPMTALKGYSVHHIVNHSRSLSKKEIVDFVKNTPFYGGKFKMSVAMLLLAYSSAREVEVCSARWQDVDINNKLWVIPPELMKMSKPHAVPLVDEIIKAIEDLRILTGSGIYLFPNEKTPRKGCIPTSSLYYAVTHLKYNEKKHFSPHDIRATFSTAAYEKGFRTEVIEAQLSHSEKNKTKASYNHAKYLDSRRELMEWWANYIQNTS